MADAIRRWGTVFPLPSFGYHGRGVRPLSGRRRHAVPFVFRDPMDPKAVVAIACKGMTLSSIAVTNTRPTTSYRDITIYHVILYGMRFSSRLMAGRKDTVPDKEILREFQETDDPFLSTKELADTFNFSNSGIRARLYSLSDDGYLDFKKVGNSPAFWITDRGRDVLAGDTDASNIDG